MPTALLTQEQALKILDTWFLRHPRIILKDPVVDYINGPYDSNSINGNPCKIFYIYMRTPYNVKFTVKDDGCVEMVVQE